MFGKKNDQKAVAIIPARLGSTRFPRKALADETGKPMVVHVCEQAAKADSVNRVVVATDSEEIKSAVEAHGFEAVMTDPTHTNGTSRLAETAKILKLNKYSTVINVQGDEPEIEPEILDASITALETSTLIERSVMVAPGGGEQWQSAGTVVTRIENIEEIENPNVVKTALGLIEPVSLVAPALYFSRAPIPFDRAANGSCKYYRHVGIYAYTISALKQYTNLPPSPLEQVECLEQMRWLENGIPVAAAIRDSSHTGIDTPEQYWAFVERFRAAQSQEI